MEVSVETNVGKIPNIINNVSTAQTDIPTNASEIATVDGRGQQMHGIATTNEINLFIFNSDEDAVETWKASVETNVGKIPNIINNVSTAQTDILDQRIGNRYSRWSRDNNVRSIATTNETNLFTLNKDVDAVETWKASVETNVGKIPNIINNVSTAQTDILTNASEIAVDGRVTHRIATTNEQTYLH